MNEIITIVGAFFIILSAGLAFCLLGIIIREISEARPIRKQAPPYFEPIKFVNGLGQVKWQPHCDDLYYYKGWDAVGKWGGSALDRNPSLYRSYARAVRMAKRQHRRKQRSGWKQFKRDTY